MQTITITTIIDHLVEVIEGITPEASPTTPGFLLDARGQGRPTLRAWAPEAGGNVMFRVFDLRRAAPRDDGGVNNWAARLATTTLALTVCYPAQPKNYGLAEYADLEALIEADAHQIHDAISSPGGLAGAGHMAVWPKVGDIDQSLDAMWFLEMPVEILYYVAKVVL